MKLYIHSYDAMNHVVARRFVDPGEIGVRRIGHPFFWIDDVVAWCTTREAAEAARRLLE